MDVLWLAPFVALLAGGLVLVLVGRRSRRAAADLTEVQPRVAAVLTEVRSLRADLERVRRRLDQRPPRAGAGTDGR